MISKVDLSDLSVDELRDLKKVIGELIKEKAEGDKDAKAEAKEKKIQKAKETLSVSDIVLFTYKGEECEGEVTKLNEKTFTVAFEYQGDDKILSRAYHLLVEIQEKEEVA